MTLIEKTNLVQYVKNDVERVGFLLLFLFQPHNQL